jgi:threonine dehydratase
MTELTNAATPVIPTYADIVAAAERIRGQAVRTPFIRSDVLDAITGARVFLKPECLQRTGSFKFRGAFNAISSGNHAQGVAEAARILGTSATIVMPSDAPAIKRRKTEGYGASVVGYDRASDDRDAITADIASSTGATIVHPYEHPGVIAGQGTIGLELIEDLAAIGLQPDAVFVCCGGGGLTAGVALAVKEHAPATDIYTVEPVGFDDQARSFVTGERLKNPQTSGSVCDSLLAPTPGKASFSINRSRVTRGLTVSDAEAMSAVAFAARELKLVVEPGGAVALAALLQGRADIRGKTVVAVLSGGNIDPDVFARALAS